MPAALYELIRYELKKEEIQASFGEVKNETEVKLSKVHNIQTLCSHSCSYPRMQPRPLSSPKAWSGHRQTRYVRLGPTLETPY